VQSLTLLASGTLKSDLENIPAVNFVAEFERKDDMNVFSSVAAFGSQLS
jgi:hypothetical protein